MIYSDQDKLDLKHYLTQYGATKKDFEAGKIEQQLSALGIEALYGGKKGHGFWLKGYTNPRLGSSYHSIRECQTLITQIEAEVIAEQNASKIQETYSQDPRTLQFELIPSQGRQLSLFNI